MIRRAIQQLPPDLVNRIAAGEVIERPASVVKELVENALDAGARRVSVEIEDGGRGLVRVVDDGAGIPPEELPLAFAQHATSKIRSDSELEAVATLGFRGEALASIGSVSRVRMLSRCGQGVAHEIRNEGGRVSEVVAAPGNAGTSIEVRDLFYNTPARRKFLKGAAAESGAITDMLVRLALPRPEVAFRYVRDGKLVADWPAAEALDPTSARMLVAWPREYHERPIAVDVDEVHEGATWRIRGIIGLPEFAATTGRYQHLYVNGRAVRDRSASHALREAYRGLTEPGRHPAAILMLTAPPGEVDVNVHPTKAEVRFRNPSRVWTLIHTAVREMLLANDLAPRARASAEPPAWSVPREDVRVTLASFFKEALGQAQHTLALGTTGGEVSAMAFTQPAAESPESSLLAESPVRGVVVPGAPEDSPTLPSPATVAPAVLQGQTLSRNGDAATTGVTRAIQLHNSYLVVQSHDGMEIIDQHALHERILYEELLARLHRGPLESQRLLLPITFEAPDGHIAFLEDLAPRLARLGIEAVPFGPGVVAVQAFPSFLSRLDPAAFLKELLERVEADLVPAASGSDEAIVHEVLDLMACKAAVKAGDPLTASEIDTLIARRDLVSRSSNCPHGRPTTLRLSLGELERQFKRTGF